MSAPEERADARRASVPEITFPEHLPVSTARDEIAAAIRDHQVVVLAGETGSGKTTQLPKILLGLGRGIDGTIGHTQPRRIAARAVAERVAEELGVPLGTVVGYRVRFHDQVADGTLVKVMTDGILLAELRHDPDLRQYDTIVIDEAHERSLTIDFLLGYLKRLLPRRPDLKVVITSATIDPERFAEHFGGAPVLTVSGRTYPVEVRYRPLGEDDDQVDGIVAACAELEREGPGDVLVFLSGEREIRDAADVLRGATAADVVPLYGRLSAAEQHVVFAPHTGRRIVLATNVAETSLTVPGIRYVVDAGTARISRFSTRTKVQRLPIERISQASATQRAGRCGRVADGTCIRLYSEEDLASRPEFTEPEVLRTNLASVLLQMAALGLGEVADFPFVEPPDPRAVRDGRQLLEELGALDGTRLTKVGRQLAQLPVDPRMGRMIVEAGRRGCVAQVLVIAAALSVQDPRERPADKQQQADELHARFADPTSDLLAWLHLWSYVAEQQEALSSSAFRRLCKREMISWLRVREWQDLHAQLRRSARQLGLDVRSEADPTTVSTALLAGLLSHVGQRVERREYAGARGTRFTIAPGTPLARKPPPLVVAAELVETSRLFARQVARIEPEWVEAVGGQLLSRTYSEPHWEARRGSVVAFERVTLYGVPVVARRRVQYAHVDPVVSRDLFLRHALVQGEWRTHQRFWHRNQQVRADVEELARRTRRHDVVADDDAIYAFYDARVPADVVSTAHFDRWWKEQRRTTPDLLDLSTDDLLAEPVDSDDHPTVWSSGPFELPLRYEFEPGSVRDGVTVDVSLSQLARVDANDLDWGVPAQREELVAALIRSLPKNLRVPLVPAPDTARALLAGMPERREPLVDALSREIRRSRGLVVPPESFDLERVPAHLRPTYRVVDGTEVVAEGKDLAAIRRSVAPRLRATVSRGLSDAYAEVGGLTAWTVGTLPEQVRAGDLVGFPTLVDEGAAVAVRVLPAPSPATHHAGARKLLLLGTPSPVRAVSGRLTNAQKAVLAAAPHTTREELVADCTAAAADALMTADPRDAAAFAVQLEQVRAGLPELLHAVLLQVADIVGLPPAVLPGPAGEDLARHRAALLHAGFVTEVGVGRLPDVVRYLRADLVRAERQPRDARRDALAQADVDAVTAEWQALPPGPGREEVRWMIEELRVSLFAQSLKAKGTVSVRRIQRRIDELST